MAACVTPREAVEVAKYLGEPEGFCLAIQANDYAKLRSLLRSQYETLGVGLTHGFRLDSVEAVIPIIALTIAIRPGRNSTCDSFLPGTVAVCSVC